MKSNRWLVSALLITWAFPAFAQNPFSHEPDRVLVFNAKNPNVTCVATVEAAPPTGVATQCPLPNSGRPYLYQGERTELRVYNRKFLTDYSISVDAVTNVVGPQIRNLEEAEGLALNSPSFIPPPSKGGTEGIPILTSGDFLLMLLNQNQVSQVERELRTEDQQIQQKRAHLADGFAAFQQKFLALKGTVPDCNKLPGSPDAESLVQCINDFAATLSVSPWNVPVHSDERAFDDIVTRTEDLVRSTKILGKAISLASIIQDSQQLASDVAEYQTWVLNYNHNLKAADAAATLIAETGAPATAAAQAVSERVSMERLRTLLIQDTADTKQADPAQVNEILNRYREFLRFRSSLVVAKAERFHNSIGVALTASFHDLDASQFDVALQNARRQISVDLPDAINRVNAAQSGLLRRVNEIYDHSEVREALPKQIDISGHTGNLIVYFTIRRIDTFRRYDVERIQAPAAQNVQAAGQVVTLPQPAPAATPVATPQVGNTQAQTNQNPAPGDAPPPGSVVAKGQLEVHQRWAANVIAAFAYSMLKDASILKQVTPKGPGNSCTTDNCFSPLEGQRTSQANLIIGIDYYLRPRDTYPGVSHWGQNALQSVGIMGAISANHANNWFLGPFWEPITGVQIAGGINFGTERRLQKNFQFGTAVDMSGDFPTEDKRINKAFVSVGLDLAIFRKVFGKITGVGTTTKPAGGN